MIESDHTDVCHVGSVNGKCLVYSLAEYEEIEEEKRANQQPGSAKKKSKLNDGDAAAAPESEIPSDPVRHFFAFCLIVCVESIEIFIMGPFEFLKSKSNRMSYCTKQL